MKSSYRPQRSRKNGRTIHRSASGRKGAVPEKGRIRIVLLLVAVFFGVKAYVSYAMNADVSDQAAVAVEVDAVEGNQAPDSILDKSVAKSSYKPKPLEYSDVKKMLLDKEPTLKSAVDTVSWKRRKLVRYFSIDTVIQQAGETLMRRYHPKYGAAVILQPRTGRVISLISYNNPEEPKISDNLYANAEFPAASIFKTVTAAAAIERVGLTKSSLLKTSGKNHTLYKTQLVEELDPSRKISLGESYAYSVNPVFGRLGIYQIGSNSLSGYAQKFGFNDAVPFELPVQISQFAEPKDTFNLAELSSGFNQQTTLSPILGALIAGSVSNKGKMIRPTLVDSVVDLRSGTKVYERSAKAWRIVMGEKGAEELKNLMEDVTQYGTARKSFKTIKNSTTFDQFTHGGKTGSVDRDGVGRVEWFVGFLKDSTKIDEDLACGVFTVHGKYWTVHSSYIGGEMMQKGIRSVWRRKKEEAEQLELIRLAREKAVKDSVKAYNDSLKLVQDSLNTVQDSLNLAQKEKTSVAVSDSTQS